MLDYNGVAYGADITLIVTYNVPGFKDLLKDVASVLVVVRVLRRRGRML